MMEIIQCFKGN